jgi:Tfp pilus assembly protein PilN
VRPVNLVPPEQRRALRGEGAGISLATRAVLGSLGLAVLAVAALVLISNQVNSKKSEAADLGSKQQEVEAVSNALRPYGNFVKLQQTRTSTVAGLARSRFNWERVLRQLSHTMPPHVWITDLSGSVSPAAGSSTSSGGASGGNSLRGNVPGPAVSMEGCARSQRDSARMIARMRTLDDVASVTLTRSELPDTEGTTSGGGGAATAPTGGTDQACPRYQFDLLVAFKADSSVAAVAGAPGQTVAPAAAGTTGTTGQTGTTGSTGTTGATPQATTAGGTGQ